MTDPEPDGVPSLRPHPSLPEGHALHPHATMDRFLGELVARKRCEPVVGDKVTMMICGCPDEHVRFVKWDADDMEGYVGEQIAAINSAFRCC